jgi:hypothetical protein
MQLNDEFTSVKSKQVVLSYPCSAEEDVVLIYYNISTHESVSEYHFMGLN